LLFNKKETEKNIQIKDMLIFFSLYYYFYYIYYTTIKKKLEMFHRRQKMLAGRLKVTFVVVEVRSIRRGPHLMVRCRVRSYYTFFFVCLLSFFLLRCVTYHVFFSLFLISPPIQITWSLHNRGVCEVKCFTDILWIFLYL
jgi:hypothetical protein